MKAWLCGLALLCGNHAQGGYEDLWAGDAPGAARPPAGTETKDKRGAISDVEVPQYQVHPADPARRTGAAVVVFPGGGYRMNVIGKEGHDVAGWLVEQGITAIVVKYRVSEHPGMGYGFPVPLLDARRAIRTVRSRAEEWGIDPGKVGVMGFSAGGHLASLAATRSADTFPQYEGKDAVDAFNARPDFAILVYPVISMQEITHPGSRERLLGKDATPEMLAEYSTENSVDVNTPPVFLVTTADDMVDCRNSLRFAMACKERNVPVTLHLFETGGHGYGMPGRGATVGWAELLREWLRTKGHASK